MNFTRPSAWKKRVSSCWFVIWIASANSQKFSGTSRCVHVYLPLSAIYVKLQNVCYLRDSSEPGVHIQTVLVLSRIEESFRHTGEKLFKFPHIPGCVSVPILFSFDTYTVLTTSEGKAILRYSVCGLLTGKIKFFFSLYLKKKDFWRRPHTIFYYEAAYI